LGGPRKKKLLVLHSPSTFRNGGARDRKRGGVEEGEGQTLGKRETKKNKTRTKMLNRGVPKTY